MARFDVHRLNGVSFPVLDIQADILRDLKTRIVIPLALPMSKQRSGRRGSGRSSWWQASIIF